jgi:putative heme iron utilization protein
MSAEQTARRPGAHGVPTEQATRTEQTLSSTPGLRGEPSDAERSRTLVTYTRHAALSTVSTGPAGHPFGSLVGYAVDGSGRPVLCLSDMAEHTGNLIADPRSSLMVVATTPAAGDPLARARVTLVGDLVEVAPAEQETARLAYTTIHPDAFYSEFADFRCYRLEVAAVRYVGGFGRMSWVGTDGYRSAEPDPLHPHADGIIEHMNDDHADALVSFCRVLGNRPETGWAEMVHVDRYGFDVLAATARGEAAQAVRICFDEQTDTPQATRAAMIALLTRVRTAGH